MQNPAEIDASEIAVFDFISHENMHHAFNEAYLRTLRAAFPADRISFHAGALHVARLAPRVSDVPGVVLKPCQPFDVPFGLSRHNPIGGRLAAHRCLKEMANEVSGRPIRLAALLGVDASLYAVVGRRWPQVSPAPLHMILHGQLGDSMVWRSRNPIIRATDLIAEVRRALPAPVRLVALELGVKEAIVEIAPKAGASILTLEHPILTSEWSDAAPPPDRPQLKIAFLGNARKSKGFEAFASLARTTGRPDLAFEAIGVAAPDTDHIDIAALARKPSRTSMSRRDYLDAVHDADLVCLPLHSRAYDFTASGTVADAVAALKPILSFRNRTLDAIFERYGPIGWLVESEAELFYLVQTLDRSAFAGLSPRWVENLRKLRVARRPEIVGLSYAGLIGGGRHAP